MSSKLVAVERVASDRERALVAVCDLPCDTGHLVCSRAQTATAAPASLKASAIARPIPQRQ
jgi:hypothetical protein